jgi:hypothetical protein
MASDPLLHPLLGLLKLLTCRALHHSQITSPIPIPVKLETQKGKTPAKAGMKAAKTQDPSLLGCHL